MSILLIEDDEPLIELLRYWLGDRPIRVARTMREANEQISARTPDHVIFDLGLPDSMPTDTIKRIKTLRSEAKDCVIIVVTGFENHAQEALEAGANLTVRKGHDARKMADDVAREIDRTSKKDSTPEKT